MALLVNFSLWTSLLISLACSFSIDLKDNQKQAFLQIDIVELVDSLQPLTISEQLGTSAYLELDSDELDELIEYYEEVLAIVEESEDPVYTNEGSVLTEDQINERLDKLEEARDSLDGDENVYVYDGTSTILDPTKEIYN